MSDEENKTIHVTLEELPKEELICQIEDADFKIRGLERQIRDLKKKIQQMTQVFENEEKTYHGVVENLTRKCNIYEKLILEQHPETELQELREAVQEEIEKTKSEIKMTPQEYEIQRNHNLEEISISTTSTPTKSSSMIVPGVFQLDFDVSLF
jgi:archaellum component FlaC